MSDQELIAQTLKFEKLLEKLKIKHKMTVLQMPQSSYRTNLYRSDLAVKTLQKEDYEAISNIFQSTLGLSITNAEELFGLLTTLAKHKMIIRLDRLPMTVKEELRKWPERMQIAQVNSQESCFRHKSKQFLQFCT